MNPLRLVLVLAIAAAACGGSPKPKTAEVGEPAPSSDRVLVNVDAEGVGLGGHDPVAYGTDGKPTPGTADQTSQHGGATYRFASAEHKTTFEADKTKHAPHYGGYCAFAASQNRLSPSDPTIFQMIDGQLLVFTNADFKAKFNQDAPGNKAKADQNWPGLVAQHGKPAAP